MRRRTIDRDRWSHLSVFSAVYGMAAGLGGITSSSLGADDVAVASCDSDGVSSGYTTAWDATDERYEVTAVTVSGVSNTCDGQNTERQPHRRRRRAARHRQRRDSDQCRDLVRRHALDGSLCRADRGDPRPDLELGEAPRQEAL